MAEERDSDFFVQSTDVKVVDSAPPRAPNIDRGSLAPRVMTRENFLRELGLMVGGGILIGVGMWLSNIAQEADAKFAVEYRKAAAEVKEGTMGVETWENLRTEYGRRNFFRDRVYPGTALGGMGLVAIGAGMTLIKAMT